MKILIWFACIFGMSMIPAAFRMNGIILGAIPMVAVYVAAFNLALFLCRKWDERKK